MTWVTQESPVQRELKRLFIKEKRYCVKAIAPAMGCCPDTLYEWASGRRPIPADQIRHLTNAVGDPIFLERTAEGTLYKVVPGAELVFPPRSLGLIVSELTSAILKLQQKYQGVLEKELSQLSQLAEKADKITQKGVLTEEEAQELGETLRHIRKLAEEGEAWLRQKQAGDGQENANGGSHGK